MGRSAIFEGIFAAITADAALMALLGPKTPTNLRVYRSFVQLQSLLKGPPIYEPSTTEGWLVLEEVGPGVSQSRTQYESIYEVIDLNCHVFAQTYGLGDDVFDYLDGILHWGIQQQRDVQYGNYYVLFSRAFQMAETYAEAITMARKTRSYRLELVQAEQVA